MLSLGSALSLSFSPRSACLFPKEQQLLQNAGKLYRVWSVGEGDVIEVKGPFKVSVLCSIKLSLY